MIERASPECQTGCDVISGSVHGIDTTEMGDGSEAIVFMRMSRDYDTLASKPLTDLGETDGHDNNEHYVRAVEACAGPIACGVLKRSSKCGAIMVGDHPLRDYRV